VEDMSGIHEGGSWHCRPGRAWRSTRITLRPGVRPPRWPPEGRGPAHHQERRTPTAPPGGRAAPDKWSPARAGGPARHGSGRSPARLGARRSRARVRAAVRSRWCVGPGLDPIWATSSRAAPGDCAAGPTTVDVGDELARVWSTALSKPASRSRDPRGSGDLARVGQCHETAPGLSARRSEVQAHAHRESRSGQGEGAARRATRPSSTVACGHGHLGKPRVQCWVSFCEAP